MEDNGSQESNSQPKRVSKLVNYGVCTILLCSVLLVQLFCNILLLRSVVQSSKYVAIRCVYLAKILVVDACMGQKWFET